MKNIVKLLNNVGERFRREVVPNLSMEDLVFIYNSKMEEMDDIPLQVVPMSEFNSLANMVIEGENRYDVLISMLDKHFNVNDGIVWYANNKFYSGNGDGIRNSIYSLMDVKEQLLTDLHYYYNHCNSVKAGLNAISHKSTKELKINILDFNEKKSITIYSETLLPYIPLDKNRIQTIMGLIVKETIGNLTERYGADYHVTIDNALSSDGEIYIRIINNAENGEDKRSVIVSVVMETCFM